MVAIRLVSLACLAALCAVACAPTGKDGTAPAATAVADPATPGPTADTAPRPAPATDAPPDPSTAGTTILGDLVYMADAARLTLCADGRSLPVAMEADWIRMERAYSAAAGTPGAPLHVSFEGRVAKRPTMEGDGTEAAMVVTRFIHAWPGEDCERSRADASLVNTYWRAVVLAGQQAQGVAGRKEPQLTLRSGDGATAAAAAGDYDATVGCNAVSGRYGREGGSLRFDAGAMTRMACPPPLDALERSLLDALARTASWRIAGPTLELFDAGGASVGLIRAVYLR